MNTKVAYVPFPGASRLRTLAEHIVAGHNAVHRWDRFAPEALVSGASALARLSRLQQLYIFGRGSAANARLMGDGDEQIGADQLARQLRDELLTPRIRVIKVWASESAAGGSSSFAARFKQELIASGFTHVVVYGYSKHLSDVIIDGHKAALDVDEAGVPIRAFPAHSTRKKF